MGSRILEMVRVARRKAAAGELSLPLQLLEMIYLMLRYRLGPGYYLMGRFWRKSLPFADKCRHWNGNRYLKFVHKVNDPRYFKVSQNKLVEKSLLLTLAIPTAPLVGLYHPSKGRSVDGAHLCCSDDLAQQLGRLRGHKVFFKPAEGDSGSGVFCLAVAESADQLQLREVPSGKALTLDALCTRLGQASDGFVIEHAIEQHPELSKLNASSVNTLRVWVVDDAKGVHVVGAFLRVGRAGSVVDNTANGGLACPVDLETGRIREALDLSYDRTAHAVHPDNGNPIKGVLVPCWSECIVVACDALRALPGARFAGMDIAVGVAGPLVVEYNVEPNQRGAAHFDVPHAVLFAGFSAG